jgi:hypothetical protein
LIHCAGCCASCSNPGAAGVSDAKMMSETLVWR